MLVQGCVLTKRLNGSRSARTGSRNPDEKSWRKEEQCCGEATRRNRKSVGLGAVSKQEASIGVRDKGHDECRWIAKNKEALSRRGKRTRSRSASKSLGEEATVEKLSRCMSSVTEKIVSKRAIKKFGYTKKIRSVKSHIF